MSPFIEYESPVSYGRKVVCRIKVFSNVGQRSRSRSCDQHFLVLSERYCHEEDTCQI